MILSGFPRFRFRRFYLDLLRFGFDFDSIWLGFGSISPGASTNLTWSFYESHLELLRISPGPPRTPVSLCGAVMGAQVAARNYEGSPRNYAGSPRNEGSPRISQDFLGFHRIS